MTSEYTFHDILRHLSGMVRVGIVTDIRPGEYRARVKFESENMTSGWLFITDKKSLKVNDKVLCLYPPFDDMDGFIIGILS